MSNEITQYYLMVIANKNHLFSERKKKSVSERVKLVWKFLKPYNYVAHSEVLTVHIIQEKLIRRKGKLLNKLLLIIFYKTILCTVIIANSFNILFISSKNKCYNFQIIWSSHLLTVFAK